MKIKTIRKIITMGFLFLILVTPFMESTYGQQGGAKKHEGKMKCEDENVITDEQWQWYECIVDIGNNYNVTLTYSGDLDLDLRLYWKRDNFPQFRGFDLTHCSITSEKYNYTDYSQFRTKNTDELGINEELYFTNPSYTNTEDKKAYILVYVHSGEGECEYLIESNYNILELEDNEVYECIPVLLILLLYISGAIVLFGLSVYIIKRKKKKLTEPKKKKKKPDKKKRDLKTIDLDSEI